MLMILSVITKAPSHFRCHVFMNQNQNLHLREHKAIYSYRLGHYFRGMASGVAPLRHGSSRTAGKGQRSVGGTAPGPFPLKRASNMAPWPLPKGANLPLPVYYLKGNIQSEVVGYPALFSKFSHSHLENEQKYHV